MAKTKDEILSDAIGDVGAEPQQTSLGRLKHAEAYGGKTELNDAEKTSMEEFLKRSRHESTREREASISDGWIPIDRSELGPREQFYPADWTFYIRPATVQAIKNWTSIDEERPEVMNRVFNDIIKTCVKIETSGESAGWAKINSWDRFWFIIKIREYTFTGENSKIDFEDDCSECGAPITYTLLSNNLHFDMPDDKLIENYWIGDHWEIDPKEYNVNAPIIRLYNPTIQKDQTIIDWAIAKSRGGQKPDEIFLRFLPWLMKSAPRDLNAADAIITKLYKEFKTWPIDYFDLMDDIVLNLLVTPLDTLKMKCPCCGQEAVSKVRFQNGIKALFRVETGARKFGSRSTR